MSAPIRAAALFAIVPACGGGRPPPPEPPSNRTPAATQTDVPPDAGAPLRGTARLIATLNTLADRMCACGNRACAEAVDAEVKRVFEDMALRAPEWRDTEPNQEQIAQVTAASTHLSECRNQKLGAGAP